MNRLEKSNNKKVVKKNGTKNVKKKSRVGLIIVLAILIILGIVGGVFAYNFMNRVEENGGGVTGAIVTVLGGDDEEKAAKLDTFYCVLLGESQNLTDTIMLVAYNPGQQKASLLSVPRDTFVGKSRSSATAYDKINALCQYTHPEKTVAAVKDVTGIDVEKYVLINTKALKKAVDLIGGVYFDVPVDMNYTSLSQGLYINLKKGYQLLDGDKAEQLVRFRHNANGTTYPKEYGAEDLGRTRTQREFLMELAKQTLKAENITKIGDFLNIFYENVKTNVTLSEIMEYLPYAVKFNTEDLKTGIVPGTPEYINSIAFYTHDKEGTAEVVEELFSTIDSDMKDVNVELLNGTGDEKVGEEVKNLLKENKFFVKLVEDESTAARTSIIVRGEDDNEIVSKIKDLLGVGIRTSGEAVEKVDITIILGKDYLEKDVLGKDLSER